MVRTKSLPQWAVDAPGDHPVFTKAQSVVAEDLGRAAVSRALNLSFDAEAQAHLANGEIPPDVRDLVLPTIQEVAVAKS
jgi:hypothetical protein